MKNIIYATLVTVLMVAFGGECQAQGAKIKNVDKWFSDGQWQLGAPGTVSVAIDKKTFAEHYSKYPERWKVVFEFIKNNDLKTISLGQSTLNDDVKLNVQEYDTRIMNKPETYEQHNQWIDVQYMVSGRELHGTVKQSQAKLVQPYNSERDIAMYSASWVPYYIIGAGEFSIFFPDDVHLTNIGYGSQTKVRKVVFKVKVQ